MKYNIPYSYRKLHNNHNRKAQRFDIILASKQSDCAANLV